MGDYCIPSPTLPLEEQGLSFAELSEISVLFSLPVLFLRNFLSIFPSFHFLYHSLPQYPLSLLFNPFPGGQEQPLSWGGGMPDDLVGARKFATMH